MNFLLLLLLTATDKIVEVRFTKTAPKIDGVLEQCWQAADSADDFIQTEPYEKAKPSEATVVYLLQDEGNLYIAFHCRAERCPPVARLGGNEDKVVVYLDPLGSRTTAYYFKVSASGVCDDGMVLDDGRSSDDSWDGVWFRAAKCSEGGYLVEMKLPFKSIRYRPGLDEWGINFKRHIVALQEDDHWTEVLRVEGCLVSKYGKLKGIKPRSSGYHFELYPEGFVRYDQVQNEPDRFKPSASLNFKWDLTPQTSLNATVLPDFAQIESDPFTMNLSQYEVFLEERRPFFLEGKDIFRMSDFGENHEFYKPLNIFYSRRIGKMVNGEPVPILGGLKLTGKSEAWNIGAFGAYTDSLRYPTDGAWATEPRRGFGGLRVKHKIFTASDIGFLFSGTQASEDNYTYAVGLDGVWRSGPNQFILQGGASDKNQKLGWAFSSGYFGLVKNFLTIGFLQAVDDSFDVGDIGYVPWVGVKKLLLISGPLKNYSTGVLRSLFVGPGVVVVNEPGDKTGWSKLGFLEVNPNFRSNWGLDLNFEAGQYYEADTNYFRREVVATFWGEAAKFEWSFGGTGCYGYNYYRQFLAPQVSNWVWFEYYGIPRVHFSLSGNSWVEWDTANTILAVTPMVTPRINFRITRDMGVEFFSEFVIDIPKTDLKAADLISDRLGLLFSWNFLPKSWLYIALNDYRDRDDLGQLQLQNRTGAIKVKYLFYF